MRKQKCSQLPGDHVQHHQQQHQQHHQPAGDPFLGRGFFNLVLPSWYFQSVQLITCVISIVICKYTQSSHSTITVLYIDKKYYVDNYNFQYSIGMYWDVVA